jgi:ComEC/Rec2-related protein
MFRKYPAIPLLLAVMLGIVVGETAHVPSWFFLAAALACVLVSLAFFARSATRPAVALAVVAAGALAGFHYVIRYVERGPHHVANAVSSREIVHLYGVVSDWPDLRSDHTDYLVDLDSIETDRMRYVDGRLLLKVTDTTTALQRGDRVEFYGRIYFINPLHTEHNSYLRRLNHRGVCGNVYLPTLLNVRVDRRPKLGVFALVDWTRTWILSAFEQNLSPPAAAIAGGFLLGETRHISTDIYTMFRDSGTLHVLAVSGSNVALVLLFVLLMLRPFGVRQPWRGIVLLAVVVLFALLSYEQPSVIRASTMAVFVLIAGILGREYDLSHIVSLSVLVILAAAPAQLYDIGFQLSAVTAWGLVLLVKPVAGLFERWHNRLWYRWLIFPVIISLVAQLCSAPLIAYHFGTVPLVSTPANLLVVPLTSVAVILLLVLLMAHLVWPLIGLLVGSLVDPVIKLLLIVLGWFRSLELPSFETGPLVHEPYSQIWVGLYLAVLVLTILGLSHKSFRRWAVALTLVGMNFFLVQSIFQAGGRKEGVHFSSLPGGIVAVVDQSAKGEADLIVSSTSVRIDNLDTRLLQPVLDMNRVKRLRYLFVMSSPYDNIDDLLRLARQYRCSTVYVAATHRASFEDFLTYYSDLASVSIVYFGGRDSLETPLGYSLSESRIVLRSQHRIFLFSGSSTDNEMPNLPVSSDPTLVLTARWMPGPDDWIRIRERGFALVVCSRIEQIRSDSNEETPADQVDLVLPEFLIDLRRTGPFHLSF